MSILKSLLQACRYTRAKLFSLLLHVPSLHIHTPFSSLFQYVPITLLCSEGGKLYLSSPFLRKCRALLLHNSYTAPTTNIYTNPSLHKTLSLECFRSSCDRRDTQTKKGQVKAQEIAQWVWKNSAMGLNLQAYTPPSKNLLVPNAHGNKNTSKSKPKSSLQVLFHSHTDIQLTALPISGYLFLNLF